MPELAPPPVFLVGLSMRTLLVLGAALLPVVARAQDWVLVDPSVAFVVTGGSWSEGKTDGQYRLIVRTAGFERVASELFVEWLTQPNGTDRAGRVLKQVLVSAIAPRVWLLERPEINCNPSACTAAITGSNTYTMEQGAWTLTLGPPGEVSVAARAR